MDDDVTFIHRLTELLVPFMNDFDSRKAFVESCLYGSPLVYEIDWNGGAQSFTWQLIQHFADREYQPGVPALAQLLTTGRESFGNDKQTEIDQLLNWLMRRPYTSSDQIYRLDERELRRFLVRHYTLDDLSLLCSAVVQALKADGFDIPFSVELVGGRGLEQITQNLIVYLDNRGFLQYLINAVARYYL